MIRYFISESYSAQPAKAADWLSRDLYALGSDPGVHLCYPGGRTFYVDPTVEESLKDQGVDIDADELEDMFWPFVSPEVRYHLRGLRHRGRSPHPRKALTATETAAVQTQMHTFDKRRYYFLRCGRRDQGQLQRIPPKMFQPLLHKSRDELEQRFRIMEAELPARELKTYVYAGFNLEKRLLAHLAEAQTATLGPQTLDDQFIRELCRLNRDPGLWAEPRRPEALRPDLRRYVWMFFDHELPQPNPQAEFIRDFMNRHRRHRPPANIEKALAEARALFGMEINALKKLSRNEFSRLYRRRARDLHPDTGGSQENFIRLTAIYRHLLKIHF
ncbi:MAG: hypothetical protein WBG37_00430 [Desulfobacterales bacterium]